MRVAGPRHCRQLVDTTQLLSTASHLHFPCLRLPHLSSPHRGGSAALGGRFHARSRMPAGLGAGKRTCLHALSRDFERPSRRSRRPSSSVVRRFRREIDRLGADFGMNRTTAENHLLLAQNRAIPEARSAWPRFLSSISPGTDHPRRVSATWAGRLGGIRQAT